MIESAGAGPSVVTHALAFVTRRGPTATPVVLLLATVGSGRRAARICAPARVAGIKPAAAIVAATALSTTAALITAGRPHRVTTPVAVLVGQRRGRTRAEATLIIPPLRGPKVASHSAAFGAPQAGRPLALTANVLVESAGRAELTRQRTSWHACGTARQRRT